MACNCDCKGTVSLAFSQIPSSSFPPHHHNKKKTHAKGIFSTNVGGDVPVIGVGGDVPVIGVGGDVPATDVGDVKLHRNDITP